MRLDVWLWAVRVFKTRSNAVEAIRSGEVQINEAIPKPSRDVHPGDLIVAKVGTITRTLRAKGAPRSRVGAALVPEYAEDLTPPEERMRARPQPEEIVAFRPRGSGRPTKRDRRRIDEIET